jgi:hypothetical protein
MRRSKSLVTLLLALAAGGAGQQLYSLPDGVEARWASAENPRGLKGQAAQANGGRKGSPSLPLKAGQQYTMAEVTGTSGTVRRIWATINDRSPRMLRGLRLDIYWDGAATPAVSAPFGDFFGVGLGRMATFQSALFASPEGRSFVCYIPMPFRKGMKMTVTNESGKDLSMLFYDVDYTVGDQHGADMLYFHALFRRESPTRLRRDYEILPYLKGKGRFLGVNAGVIADKERYANTWWGEGEVKVYFDGDREFPTLSGTGTEDYIGTGWGQGQYTNLYQGCTVADGPAMRYCFYRYHVPDPIYFRKDIRVTIQQIGYMGPEHIGPRHRIGQPLYRPGPGEVEKGPWEDGLFERQDDWSSCAYFYLDAPENGLAPLDPVEARTRSLE